MHDYVICTDATCDLSSEYLQQNDVLCLPMLYSVEGKDYYLMGKGESLPMQNFYAKMRTGAVTKTAQVTPEAALDFLRPIAQQGKDILYIGFSSALSGTLESVAKALTTLSDEFPKQTFASVDTLGASSGEGLMVHYSVLNRNAGMGLEENRKYIEDNKQSFVHFFTVDDLHHLHRGGRVSKLTAIVGTLLGIKPILHVNPEGKLIAIDKVKGRQKALRSLVLKMKEKMTDLNQPIFISHGDALPDAQLVANFITEELGITNITINFIGPVVGAHSGPGTVALFFKGKDRTK